MIFKSHDDLETHDQKDEVKVSKQLDRLYEEMTLITADLTAGRLYPYQFFIAWHGVITITFRCFPDSLLTLKDRLNQSKFNFAPENDGSRWPKITLAALSPTKRLGKEELSLLNNCCMQFSERVSSLAPLVARQLSIVHYAQQSLEKCTDQRQLSLKDESDFSQALPPLQAEVEKLFASKVGGGDDQREQKILAVGRNASHYRMLTDGVSLVFAAPHVYQDTIALLQQDVSKILPNHYEWFKPESRHLTVRALY